eukprot:symbB.v1.2.003646.t1/scaffold175.1/size369221/2
MECDQAGSSAQGLGLLVKRLMTDPKDLCCPISHELMKDPVVAEDGHTYERSCIAGAVLGVLELKDFETMGKFFACPRPQDKGIVLNPNQHVKTSIMSFKENAVTEIMNVAPGFAPELAAKLLGRAEEFIREQLPDGSARRKLSRLLLLKMKLPDIKRNETIQEIVSLLVQVQDDGQLQQFLNEADESECLALLPNLSEEMVASLCNAMQTSPTSFKVLIEKEYICRLASDLRDTERLRKMWDLLLTNSMDEVGDWTRAAAVVLAAFIDRLEAPLKELDQELLTFARLYLEARQDAIVFAEQFFQAIATEEAQSFKKTCEELQRKCTEQQKQNEDLKKEQQKGVEDVRKKLNKRCLDLEKVCKELQSRCGDLEKTGQTLQVPSGMSFCWDLSAYDFSNFSRSERKQSDKFQICSGIAAWIVLYPKGNTNSPPGKAAMFLNVDKAAKVKVRFRAGQVDRTLEHDYSTTLTADGRPQGMGPDFIDGSALQGASITVDVLSVQPANSSLKFLAPGAQV